MFNSNMHRIPHIHLFAPSVVELCICSRIQALDMVLEWVAYSSTKNGVKLAMDTLEQFKHEVTKFIVALKKCTFR